MEVIMSLKLDKKRKVIGGVCAGLSNHLKVDLNLVRLLFVLGSVAYGGGLLLYLILWGVLHEVGK
jgi:phage shock protein PspC (stress-responsive transcriptional regulator)